MDEIKEVITINWGTVIVSIFVLLAAVKYGWELVDWFIKKIKIKTNADARIKSDHDLIVEMHSAVSTLQDQITTLQAKDQQVDSSIALLTDAVNRLESWTELQKQTNVEMIRYDLTRMMSYYMYQIKAIPAEEFPIFTELSRVYTLNGGNHGLQAQIDLCIKSVPVLPRNQIPALNH